MEKFELKISNVTLHDNKLVHSNDDGEVRWCISLAEITEVRQFIGIDPNGTCFLTSALAVGVLLRETNPGTLLTVLAYLFALICLVMGLVCVRQRKLGVVANGKQYNADLFDMDDEDEFVAEIHRQLELQS